MKISDLIDNKTITDVSMAELINLSGIEGSEDSSSKINLFDLFDVYSGAIIVPDADTPPMVMFANYANTKCSYDIYYDGDNAETLGSILSTNGSRMKLCLHSLRDIFRGLFTYSSNPSYADYRSNISAMDISMNFGNMDNMYFIANPRLDFYDDGAYPATTSFNYTKSSTTYTYYYINYDKLTPPVTTSISGQCEYNEDGPRVIPIDPENINITQDICILDTFSESNPGGYSADEIMLGDFGFILIPKKTNGLFTRTSYGKIVQSFSLDINDCIDEFAVMYPGFAHKYTSLEDIKNITNTKITTDLYLDYLTKNFFDLAAESEHLSYYYQYKEIAK